MSMLHIIPSPRVPPGQYRFTHEDGHRTRAGGYNEWKREIYSYRRMNGLPIPDNMMAIAEDQLCRQMPPGICEFEDGSGHDFTSVQLELGDIVNGTKVLLALQAERLKAAFGLAESPFVSQELAEERAANCAACPFNVGAVGCVSCHELNQIVTSFKGDRSTRADPFLHSRACAVCKCSTETQIWIDAKVLAKGVDAEMLARFPEPDACWKRREIEQLSL